MTLREIVMPALLLLCVLTGGAIDVGAALAPQENWNVVLTPVVTGFHDHAGLDHHQPSRKLILSANTAAGESHSFELLAGDGVHAPFSNVAGLHGDVLVATARDDGQGSSRGGFQPGTLFASTGAAGVVARISADGASVQNPWVVLPDEAQITGLHLDRTGVFGGDLLVVTAAGGVWRVSSSATPVRLAALETRLAGVTVVPDDVLAYGPWAGRVLAGAKELGSVYAIDAQGQAVPFPVGLNPQDIDIVPAHENFYAIDHTSRKLLGAPQGALTGIIGDILVTQESPGRVSRVRWDGTGFVIAALAEAPGLKQVAFSPAGAGHIPAVKQVYEKIAVVRRAPQLDSGRIEGTVWQLTGEDTLFDGTDTITSDHLVPGTPQVTAAATASYGGTIEGTESAAPTGYKVTIAGKATLRHVVTRTAPIVLQEIAFPPAPQGTRDVQLRKAADPIGDPATLRHLDVAGNTGSVAVPPGTYGKFTVSGRNTLVLGVEGSTEPVVYNLEELALTGGSSLRLAGPVTLRVRNAVTLVGSTVGAADDPKRLRLEVAHGRPADAVKVGGTGVLYAIVRAPRGKITIHGSGRLRGTVTCDFLHVDGNGVLQITENDIPPPPVNRPPTASAGPDHTITLPIDTAALEGTASDDGLPTGSTLAVTWTTVSGPGPVVFAEAGSAATSATFSIPGDYVLKVTASDGQLSSSDTVAVTVIPRNQAPTVDAGTEQTIELPAPAELHGTVTDDALPRGSSVTVTWSMLNGPGEVTFADANAAATTASFSAPGVYTLRLSADDTEFTVTDDVVVTVLKNVAPTVDAGEEQTIELPAPAELHGTVTDDGLPRGSSVTVTWSEVAGPGEVTFADANAAVTTASFSAPGVYTLRLSASDTQLTVTDDVVVTVLKNVAPTVDAGAEQTIELPAPAELHGAVTDDGLPRGSSVTMTWSMLNGPGEVTFADANAAVTTASFSAPGVYTLRLSASDTQLTVEDDVVVTVLKNVAPVVDAGPEQTIELPAPAELHGTVTDDGLPRGSSLTVTWSEVDGPGEVTFAAANAAVTTASFSVPGIYTLRLSASDTQLTVTDDVVVTVLKNVAPSVDAGPEQTIELPAPAELHGTVTDDGLPLGSSVTITWSMVNGPGGVTFADANAAITTASFSAPGVYTLRLTASDTEFTVEDDVVVTVLKNVAPTVDAGAEQTIELPAPAELHGTVTDDGLPRGSSVTVTWSMVNGPGEVTFADANAAVTTASFTAPGVYTLRLSASDTQLTVTDDVVVTVLKNVAPSVDAGPAQTIELPAPAELHGTVTDDGLPRGSSVTVTWSVANGPGPVTFADANAAATTASFSAPGVYTLRLSASDTQLTVTDDVVVTVLKNAAPTVDAGPAQTIELPAPAELHGTVTDDGLPRGSSVTVTWSVVDGPGEVTFAGANAAVTTASFSIPGIYTLRLRASDTEFTVEDDIVVTVLKNVAPTVDAGLDRTITLPVDTVALEGTATDDGLPSGNSLAVTWTKVSGPGAVVFENAQSAATTATFSLDGVYELQLTASDGALSSSDTVTVTVIPRNEPPVVDAGQAQTIRVPSAAELRGTVTDDGLPRGSVLTVSWIVADGPGPVTFADPHAAVTTASFSARGVYTLRLSASDTELTVSDDVIVTVLKNDPPSVNAGADQAIILPGNVLLSGTASDDGYPAGSTLEVFWTQVSGSVPAIFHDAFAVTTPVTFAAPGTYVLRLTASDSELSASDDVTIVVQPQPFTSRTYTLDAHFSEGNLVNLTRNVPHQLQLDDATRTFNFIWVAVSSKGTIVKIDTETGAVLGEYATSPDGQPKDPSRTTVDNNGNVWAGNRAGYTVVNVGLAENGQCVDRNNNGVIDTSTGFGDVRPWPNTGGANTNGGVSLAQDECIRHYTRVAAERVRHVSVTKDNDVWVTGWGGVNQGYFDLVDGKTGLVKRSERSVGYGGYGGLVDKSGILWSARGLLRWDTSKPLTGPNAVNGMAFTLYGGRATWDRAGRTSAQSPSEEVWVDDRVPAGAAAIADGDSWNWTSANPAPFSGTVAHQSNISGGTHQHYFDNAADMLTVGAGDTLFTYVYIDPANVPSQVMLQWNNADWNWEHRAYWGVNHIGWGVHGTESRYYMGPVPTPGQWVRLEVPASLMGLEGSGANWRGYDGFDSYGLCIDSQGNVWNTALEWNQIRKFAPDGRLLGIFQHGAHNAQGCVVDKNGDVWVAHSRFDRTVGRLKNDGTYVGKIMVGDGPTGVAVDAKGKIWATNHNAGTVVRIDPTRGPVGEVDFTSGNLGGNLYNYSDMTGSTLTGKPEAGTWSTVYDSGKVGAEWGRLGWTASVCGDGLLSVSVATSENGTTFGPAETVTNGTDPAVANGRYLRVSVNFKRASSGESPILYDLSVGTSGYALPAAPNTAPGAVAGSDLTMTLPDPVRIDGSACDDGFPRGNALTVSWTKVSGPGTATFTNQGSSMPSVTFTLPGDYVLRLTVSDGQHTASDEVSVTALPANTAPAVNAGPNQTITLPDAATLNGTVSDDGLPAGSTVSTFWSMVSGPGTATFNDPTSTVTGAIFPVTGTYTLRLSGGDSHRTGTDDVVITVNPSPALNGATLALVAVNAGPYVTGTPQPLQATLRSSTGTPLANYGVEFKVTGANATTGSAVTNASGVATFIHSGTNLGTDTVSALVRHTATTNIDSPSVAMTWAEAAVPAVQGWIGEPRNGTIVTGFVPITVGAVTLTQGTVEYWPASNPSAVTVLAAGAQGGPNATLATLDTTLLANGNYVIRLSATDSNGQSLVSQVLITVIGENKPGRLTFVITDLIVPASGIPITIKRRYDSLERNQSGDFGYGWSLEMAGPRLDVSPDYDVTVTEPGTGRRVTFQFAPTGFGFPFSFLYQPEYTPEQGVYGKLTANGCGTLIKTSSGVSCYMSSDPYRPTIYTYTDPYGRVYTMTAAGKMQSIRDLDGNVLTFSASGITSSAGNLNVPFVRDAQGRITQITDPNGRTFRYGYDAAGDLSTIGLPGVSTPVSYTYEAGHYYSSSTDARGNEQVSSTYHPDGRLASVTDAVGDTTSYAYALAENKTTVTYPDAGVAAFTYAPDGLLLSRTDPLGHKTTYTYDANRNKLTETNALLQTTTHTYDSRGNLTSTTDPAGKTERWTYNQYGTALTATDQLGNVQTTQVDASFHPVGTSDALGTRVAFTWDARGNPLSSTDGNGKVTRFTYDAYGHMLSKTDPLGRTTSYTYDGMGRAVTMTDARGTTRSTYDELGRLLTLTDPLDHVTRYEYDDNGNKTAQVDAAGRRTTYEYDAANRLTKVINPDSTELTYTYNFRGQRLTETDEEGHTTSYAYDKAGRRVKVVNADGTEVTYIYDALDRVTSETDERNRTTRYEYDQGCGCSERLTKITDANGGVISYGFDAAGRRISERDANQRETRFDYDIRKRLIQTTHADGRTTKQTYDGAGRKLTEVDEAGRVTHFAYDEAGNLISVTDALGQTTVNSYDALDNLVSTTDPLGRTTRYEYDALDRMVKRVLPLGMAESYTYDQVGNRVTRTDFLGKRTAYAYDSRNRLVRKTPDASLGEPPVSFTYSPAGQRASMADASGTTLYSYDARHQRLSKQTPQGTLTYTYDAAGNLASLRSSNTGGVSVDYTYDDLSRIASVVDNRLAGGTTTYSYDAVGNTLGIALPNGVQTAYTYDSLHRPTHITHARGATLASYAQTLDPTGRRLSVTEHNGRNVSYSYDALYRLTGETVAGDSAAPANGSVAYTYDAVANRLSRASTLAAVLSAASAYDPNDRLTSEAYDANGNTRAANGLTATYDFEDRIRTANGGAIRIVYDGDGNRVAKTVDGVTTRYLVDDLNPTGYSQVVEELVAGSVQRVYTYGNSLIGQSQQRNGGWQASFYGHDAHGNVRFLTDVNGAVTDTYAYDAFGVLTSSTGTTPNDYLFSGQQYDHDLGLYFKRARYYSQDRGRFMTMDPVPGRLDEPATLHRYLFGHADPVNRIDPCGTTAMTDTALITRLVVGGGTIAALGYLAYTMNCRFWEESSVINVGPPMSAPPQFQPCLRSRSNDDEDEDEDEDDDDDDRCEAQRADEEARCESWWGRSKQNYSKLLACKQSAFWRYWECKTDGEPHTPLSPHPFQY